MTAHPVPERSRLEVLGFRNGRRLGLPEFLAGMRQRIGLDVTEDDVIDDGEWSLRAVDGAFAVASRTSVEGTDALEVFPDYGAVWTRDRAVALAVVARGLRVVQPTLFHADESRHLRFIVRVAGLADLGAEWWVSLADADDRTLLGLSDDGTAGVCLLSDTSSGREPREWCVEFWTRMVGDGDGACL